LCTINEYYSEATYSEIRCSTVLQMHVIERLPHGVITHLSCQFSCCYVLLHTLDTSLPQHIDAPNCPSHECDTRAGIDGSDIDKLYCDRNCDWPIAPADTMVAAMWLSTGQQHSLLWLPRRGTARLEDICVTREICACVDVEIHGTHDSDNNLLSRHTLSLLRRLKFRYN
jgi:hypothetical protein